MALKSRRKGYVNEHDLEHKLNELGIPTKRIPMSGQASFTGDLILQIKDSKYIAEVKAWARNFPEYEMLNHADIVFKRTTRIGYSEDWLVVIPINLLVKLINS